MSAITTLRELAPALPHRIRAAQATGLDSVRLSVEEAQAIVAILPAVLADDADVQTRARRAARTHPQ